MNWHIRHGGRQWEVRFCTARGCTLSPESIASSEGSRSYRRIALGTTSMESPSALEQPAHVPIMYYETAEITPSETVGDTLLHSDR